MSYTEGDNEYLVYAPNTRMVEAVGDVISKESQVGSIPDNTEKLDLLDKGSHPLGTWHADDCHQSDGNNEKHGTSTVKKEGWQDAENLNTQNTPLRRDAPKVEEAAQDEESTPIRENRNQWKTRT